MKVAIVHDWMLSGGAEKVVEQLHKIYPDAPIYTSLCSDEWRAKLNGKVQTGYLQSWPFAKTRKFIPFLRGWWFSRLDLSSYDLVISSSGAEAKFIKVPEKTKHIAYIHAPTHYYWSRYEEYMTNPGFGFFDPLARIGLKILVGPMRRWDFKAAQRPDYLIANSNHTKEQIQKYYNRNSVVIHPPVDVQRFNGHNKPADKRHGYVTAGRQTPYKRIDLAVRAATELNVPLIVVGKGPDHKRLKKMAGRSVTFLTKVTDEQIGERFGESKAFIFPGIDDFGIVAVEAMAAGTPVIAYKAGGALDYVDQDTGVFFNEQSVEGLVKALQALQNKTFNHNKIASQSSQFSPKVFKVTITTFIQKIARTG